MNLRRNRAGTAQRARLEARGENRYCLSGTADSGNAGRLLAEGKRAFTGTSSITVDLGDCDCASSAGLALLLEWSLWCTTQGIELHYHDATPGLVKAAAIHGVTEALPLRRSDNDSTASPASGRHREGLGTAPTLPAARR